MAQISRENFNFTSEFQDLVLACVLKRPEFVRYAGVISPKFFTGSVATLTARAIFAYHEKRRTFPTKEVLLQIVSDEARKLGEAGDDLKEYVAKLFKIKTLTVWEDVHERVVNFCRERAILKAFKAGTDAFKKGETPKGGYVKLFEDAMAVGANLDDQGIDLSTKSRDVEEAILRLTADGSGVKTGYPALDAVWRNGWQPGWLIVPLAPPKRYKTAFSINLAINMAKAGTEVIYYACEISQDLAAMRAIQNLTDTTEDYIYKNPGKFIRNKLQDGLNLLGGRLLIKSYPSKSAKISDLEAHFNSVVMTTGMEPRVVVIDYAETVAPSQTKNISEHQQQASIYTDARAFGTRAKVTVIMPDRCTREATDATVPNMKAFQGSFQKAGIVDVAIGLCATEEEMMKGVIRYFVFLNRHGEAFGYFKGNVEANKMKMELQEILDYTPEMQDSGDSGARHGRKGKVTVDPSEDAEADEPSERAIKQMNKSKKKRPRTEEPEE